MTLLDKLVIANISNKLYSNRLIFDGYPRTLPQANNLNTFINKACNQKIDFVFSL